MLTSSGSTGWRLVDGVGVLNRLATCDCPGGPLIRGAMMVAMGLRAVSPVLVGRQGEMARLVEALDVAVDGGSAVALVGGEAGVGKSRLVQEFSGLAKSRGWRVCVGRCLEFGAAVWPLAPLSEIVVGLVDELDGDALDLVVGDSRGVLGRLVPALGGERPGDTAVSSEQLCELVIGMFGRLAQRRPLVLVIEDLHWADDTTRMLFAALAAARRVRPLLLVGTFRSDELNRRHPLRPMLAEVERGRCERIEVRPLDRAACAELVDVIHGSAVDRSFVEAVHRRSAGNPFFVEELVAAQRSGITGLPDTLRDVILARAAALDDTAVNVLGVAAAAGSTVPGVLADVCGLGAEALQGTLAELFATAVLVPDGDEIRFRHELGREVFYDELLPGQRAAVHAHLADSLQGRRPERLGEIARHWVGANDLPRALAASIVAGRQTLRTGAAAEAANHFARALEMWPAVDDVATRCDVDHPGLLLEAAVAAEHAHHLERAVELARQATAELTGLDPMREGAAWLLLRKLYRFTDRRTEYSDAVTRALALIPESPPTSARVEALAAAAMNAGYDNRADDVMLYARQAMTVAGVVGDLEMTVEAENALGWALYLAGDLEGSLVVAMASLDRCGSGVSTERALLAFNGVLNGLIVLGRYREMPAVARRGVELARSTGLGGPRIAWIASHWVSSLVALGRWDEAEHVVGELADIFADPTEEYRLAFSWGLALIRQGRLCEARPLIDQARAVLGRGSWVRGGDFRAAAIVEFDAAESRDVDVVRVVTEHLDRSRGRSEGAPHLVATGIAALADRVHTRPTTHEALSTARRWIELIDSASEGEPDAAVEQPLHRDHALAELERLEGRSDPERWARVATGWTELGLPYEAAVARYRRAEAVLAGTEGRTTTARRAAAVELAAARAIASDLHAAPLLSDIDGLARRARLLRDPNTPPAGQPGGDVAQTMPIASLSTLELTPRELDVLALLTRGRSNGQIGKELFISTKTASTHVSNIIRKLGVANRVEAAAVAQHRWSPPSPQPSDQAQNPPTRARHRGARPA